MLLQLIRKLKLQLNLIRLVIRVQHPLYTTNVLTIGEI